MRQIFIDTETTGLNISDGHRVIEIGCVEMVNRRLTGNHFHCYVNPEREVEAEALGVHGITNEFLEDKPMFSDMVEDMLQFVRGAELVAHNAPFDVGFIDHEMKLTRMGLGKITDYCKVFDTLKLARQMHPGQRNSLDALCKRYEIKIERELHGALLDAEILAQVYLAMTGGQTKLFEEKTTKATKKTEEAKITIRKDRKPLPVILASKEELKAHANYIQLLNEKSDGQSLF